MNGSATTAPWRRAAATVGWVVLALLLLAGIWWTAVPVLNLDAFGTPTPWGVLEYWIAEPGGAERRAPIWKAMGVTLTHAGLGYVVGTAAGVAFAMIFVASPRIERATMPALLVIQTIPILAILPLFIMLLGRGLVVTTTITSLAVFFPTLVWVSQGLRSPHASTLDVFRGLNASAWSVMLRLRLPSAVVGLFVAARLAVPGAIFGAFVSEWLATGDGLGYMVVIAMQGVGGFAPMWTVVTATTLLTVLAYLVVEIAESFVLARFAPERLPSV